MNKNFLNKFEQECLSYLVACASRDSIDRAEYQLLIREIVRKALPHQGVISGVGIKQFNRINITKFIEIDYSPAFLAALSTNTTVHERPLMAMWLEIQKPMMVTLDSHSNITSSFELYEMQAFDLAPMLIHGQRDISGKMSSYFNFSQCQLEVERACLLINIFMPYLHKILMKVLFGVVSNPNTTEIEQLQLSVIEWELVDFMCKGLSNKEIAQLQGKSQFTIKNQLSKLFQKLSVTTRAEAIAFLDQHSS